MASRRNFNGCVGKQGHDEKHAAVNHMRRLVAQGARVTRLHVYHCPLCRKWHVGHWPSRKTR